MTQRTPEEVVWSVCKQTGTKLPFDPTGTSAAFAIACVEADRQETQAEIDLLERLVYVPGLWKCQKCKFSLLQRNLNAADGTITARDQPGDKCPNCGGPLWRVTERDAGNELIDRWDQQIDEFRRLKQFVEALFIGDPRALAEPRREAGIALGLIDARPDPQADLAHTGPVSEELLLADAWQKFNDLTRALAPEIRHAAQRWARLYRSRAVTVAEVEAGADWLQQENRFNRMGALRIARGVLAAARKARG